jgi:DNA-binding XRE family transcriptional regulator
MALADNEKIPTGAMFRAARGLAGLSVSGLAEALGISRKTVYSIEEDISFRADSRRDKIVQAMRAYFETKHRLLFLFDEGGLGEGVRSVGKRQPTPPPDPKDRKSRK